MSFTVDFLDGTPVSWTLTGSVDDPGWSVTCHESYRPALYAVSATGMTEGDPDPTVCADELTDLRASLAAHPAVADLAMETGRPGFRMADQPVLRIDADRVDAVRDLGAFVERQGPPGQSPFRAFDVDLSPQFRFCLDRGVSPTPARPPRVLHLGLSREAAAEDDIAALELAPSTVAEPAVDRRGPPEMVPAGETSHEALATLRARLASDDPDVLAVERAAVVPLVAEAAREHGVDVGLGRAVPGLSCPDYQQLAGRSTFESYGKRHHSPARYDVPGRVVLDRSNTFFYHEAGLAGCLDLVERSRKPLGELAWASIGNVLTAIQIRAARERGVLVQWRAWRPERFKSARTLHAGDRGGTTLSPVVGLHEDVHELDFASLYPSIIRAHNLSPETVRCRCHDSDDVPELGYTVCPEPGYLPDVLGPIIDDRADIKRRLAEDDLTAAERDRLSGRSSALKWILVSCFGYQGFSNAKFGRIEVHEAINAYARDVLLTAKERLEAGGWRVLHGIVDSLWVTPRAGAEQTPLSTLAEAVTDEVGIPLEYEGAFDWVAFCPRTDGDAGALTRYVGRRRDPGHEDRFKLRGIECRQRSTPEWVGDLQRDLLTVLDERRDATAVLDHLRTRLRDLRQGAVDAERLVVRTRASKDVSEYRRRSRTVAALERAERRGIDTHAGQDIAYVVADDDGRRFERVRLDVEVEAGTPYDAEFYRTLAVRAAASVLSPLGWDEGRVESALSGEHTPELSAFGAG